MPDTVSAVAGSTVAAPGDYIQQTASEASNELGKDEFLQLLVAQLKYQDPMAPSSSDEFIATSAQFTVVEKLDELTKQGENSALITSLTTASALIGREITVISGDSGPVTATVERSQIISGEVVLVTDQGQVQLNQIVSVGSVQPAGVDVPETDGASTSADEDQGEQQ